jgi:hypothetical protein
MSDDHAELRPLSRPRARYQSRAGVPRSLAKPFAAASPIARVIRPARVRLSTATRAAAPSMTSVITRCRRRASRGSCRVPPEMGSGAADPMLMVMSPRSPGIRLRGAPKIRDPQNARDPVRLCVRVPRPVLAAPSRDQPGLRCHRHPIRRGPGAGSHRSLQATLAVSGKTRRSRCSRTGFLLAHDGLMVIDSQSPPAQAEYRIPRKGSRNPIGVSRKPPGGICGTPAGYLRKVKILQVGPSVLWLALGGVDSGHGRGRSCVLELAAGQVLCVGTVRSRWGPAG